MVSRDVVLLKSVLFWDRFTALSLGQKEYFAVGFINFQLNTYVFALCNF
jgi:hypothetical protein